MAKKNPNVVSQKQFRGPAPRQPVDADDRVYRVEANPPSKAKRKKG